MKRFGIVIILLLVIALAATNPGIETHKVAVKEAYNELINKEVDGLELGEGLSILGKGLGNSIADGILDQKVGRKNLFLFSLTLFEQKGEEKVIGIGLFGQVILLDKPEFDKSQLKKKFNLSGND